MKRRVLAGAALAGALAIGLVLASCGQRASPTGGDVERRSSAAVINPTVGGPAYSITTYAATSLGGSYAWSRLGPPPLNTAAAVLPYMNNAATNWGCSYNQGANPVVALPVPGTTPVQYNFYKLYGTPANPASGCGIVYWNRARQAAYFQSTNDAINPTTSAAIRAEWGAHGYEAGILGMPISNPVPTGWAGVTYQLFTRGIITYHPTFGAHHLGGAAADDLALAVAFESALGLGPSVSGSPPAYALTQEPGCANSTTAVPYACGAGQIGKYSQFHDAYWDPLFYRGGNSEVYVRLGDPVAFVAWEPILQQIGLTFPPGVDLWNTPMGIPLSNLTTFAVDGQGRALQAQQFEKGKVTWKPDNNCSGSGAHFQYGSRTDNTYVATPILNGAPLYMPTGQSALADLCNAGINWTCHDTHLTPVPFSVAGRSGSYFWKCDNGDGNHGQINGITINFSDGSSRSIDNYIFDGWRTALGSNPTGDVIAAMGTMAVVWGWLAADPLRTGAEGMQAFDQVWVYSDPTGHLVSYADGRATVRLNEVRAGSSHNSYDSTVYGNMFLTWIFEQRVRSIELDIHSQTDGGTDTYGTWEVYHQSPGNNCLFADQHVNGNFAQCLAAVRSWHDWHPLHEVITSYVDADDPAIFDPSRGRGVPDFDAQVDAVLGAGNIYKPATFVARACAGHPAPAPDLQTAVANCGWPTLAELRGKFILIMTDQSTDPYRLYGPPLARSAYSAMEISNDPGWYPHLPSYDLNQVFYNVGTCGATNWSCDPEDNGDTYDAARNVWSAGGVGRIYRINNVAQWDAAVSNQAQVLATNNYASTGFVTWRAGGYPFSCIDPTVCNTTTWTETLTLDP
jgi:hypothetical protein